jgi:hypothetical protein
MATLPENRYYAAMNLKVLVIMLLLLVGGGGYLFGGPLLGLGEFAIILLISFTLFLMGGFRTNS